MLNRPAAGQGMRRGHRECSLATLIHRLTGHATGTARRAPARSDRVASLSGRHPRVWDYSHRLRCGDILTTRDVRISSQGSKVASMTRKTIEVRKPRDIGDTIRAMREARGISQEDLAQANAYDRFYLTGLESGRGTLYITRLLRTLKSLGITLSVTFDPDAPDDSKSRADD